MQKYKDESHIFSLILELCLPIFKLCRLASLSWQDGDDSILNPFVQSA